MPEKFIDWKKEQNPDWLLLAKRAMAANDVSSFETFSTMAQNEALTRIADALEITGMTQTYGPPKPVPVPSHIAEAVRASLEK